MTTHTKFVAIAGMLLFMSIYFASQKETRAQEDALVVPETLPADASGAATQAGGELLTLLADMRTIRLDESLFSDPAFQELQDFSVALRSEPKGRPNPFAPLGKDAILEEETPSLAPEAPPQSPFEGN